MEVTINYNGQAVAVEVTLEVYEFLDRADHKTENLFHEQRRHWDGREFDEYIITTEGVGVCSETPEEYLCRMETLHELMAVLDNVLSSAYASRQIDLAPVTRFKSACVSHFNSVRSFFPVIIRRTSSASGRLSLKSPRMNVSSIGRKLRRRSRSS